MSQTTYLFVAFLFGSQVISARITSYLSNNYIKRYCGANEFACDDECIDAKYVCDSKYHCKNHADEDDCSHFSCLKNSFRCNYGGCIDAQLVCNGKIDCIDLSDEVSCNNTTKTCSPIEFQCHSMQCIPDEFLCDGTPHCNDSSDEHPQTCTTFPCPAYAFQCTYGACINEALRCDGVPDCVDGSDEENCTRYKRGCAKPQVENGRWMVERLPAAKSDGDFFATGTMLRYVCDAEYALNRQESVVKCEGIRWDIDGFKCLRTCPSLSDTNLMHVKCEFEGREVNCSTPYEGTKATFNCKSSYYERLDSPIRYCVDGDWDYDLPVCEPKCGVSNRKPPIIPINNGEDASFAEVPWMVAIYENAQYGFVCGGVLISAKLTLTAAHCDVGFVRNKYVLVAGKLYREFGDNRDALQRQTVMVKSVIKHPLYNDTGYQYDLAIMIHQTEFTLNYFVAPACLYSQPFAGFLLADVENQQGMVSGWGFTKSTGILANQLQKLYVNIVGRNTCVASLPVGFAADEYADYKVCAGILNQNKSTCDGDSGSGLVFRNKNDRYFLMGIVSSINRKDGCDINSYTLYTNITYFMDFIQEQILIYS